MHLLYIHQIHVRFNKPTEYRIFHKIIQKYKTYMPYQWVIVKRTHINTIFRMYTIDLR
jgi:hypothetical protein